MVNIIGGIDKQEFRGITYKRPDGIDEDLLIPLFDDSPNNINNPLLPKRKNLLHNINNPLFIIYIMYIFK